MDRFTLAAALRDAGVSGYAYQIEGVHEHDIAPVSYYFLRRRQGTWQIGVFERGVFAVAGEYTTEHDACTALWTRLTTEQASHENPSWGD
ncbi:hypothetical protein [Amycolatopsis anabasis]|uniref:hypothetical protein n=1 Tax=Amycolatopsis anabasis TaxID=1840409 RepID=UPI00131BD653|nr:hypothetical protein [Amycolatopsis anabasis]